MASNKVSREEVLQILKETKGEAPKELRSQVVDILNSPILPGAPKEGYIPEGRGALLGAKLAGQMLELPSAIVSAPIISTLEGKGPIAGIKESIQAAGERGVEGVLDVGSASRLAAQFPDIEPSGKEIVPGVPSFEGPMVKIPELVKELAWGVAKDPMTYGANKFAKLVASPFKKVAANQVAKNLSQYVSKVDYLKKGFDPVVAGNYIVDRGVTKYLNNPKKLKEVISGTTGVTETGPSGYKIFKKTVDKDSGMLGAIYHNLTEKLVEHSDVPTRSLEDIANSVVTKFQNRMQAGTAFSDYAYPNDPAVAEKIMAHIKDYLKLYPGGNDPKTSLPLKNLNDIRTMLNHKVTSKNFHDRVKAGDTGAILEGDVIMGILGELKSEIGGALDAVKSTVTIGGKTFPTSHYYEAQNAAMSQLLKLDEALAPEILESLKKSDLAQVVSQALTGVGIGVGLGSIWDVPVKGAAIGGAYGIVRSAMDVAKEKTPGAIASLIMDAPKSPLLPPAPSLISKGLQSIGGDTQVPYREPQSVNIPEQLVRTPVPRSTEEVLQKKEFVKMKIAQMYPDMYEQVAETLDNYPEFIEDMMPLMAIQMPGLFPKDKYNRIDGKIFGPQDKARAIKDVYDDGSLSNTQKALKIQRLNLTGEFR